MSVRPREDSGITPGKKRRCNRDEPLGLVIALPPGYSSIRSQIYKLNGELEPVRKRRARRRPICSWRSTYRAILASNGYLVGEVLGSGSYGTIRRALCCSTDRRDPHHPIPVAIKIINLSRQCMIIKNKFIPRELQEWSILKHENIIRLLGGFFDDRRLYMVMELAEGGDLHQYVITGWPIAKRDLERWTAQLAKAIEYLHAQDIVHRDLKLDNILVQAGNIKLTDFSFVRKVTSPDDLSSTFCGTEMYKAPEVIAFEEYEPKAADVWSLAVIYHRLTCGTFPVDFQQGKEKVRAAQKALQSAMFVDTATDKTLPRSFHRLLHGMFAMPARKRLTAAQVAVSAWVKNPR